MSIDKASKTWLLPRERPTTEYTEFVLYNPWLALCPGLLVALSLRAQARRVKNEHVPEQLLSRRSPLF